MPAKLEISMKNISQHLDINISSLLQGALMELIDIDYAAQLHSLPINPYSQNVRFDADEIIWTINSLNNEAYEKIIMPMMNEKITTIQLKYKNLELEILKRGVQTCSYDKLINDKYLGECKPYLSLRFETPTAFKVNGRYQFYPTVQHFFNSLIRKFDANSDKMQIGTEDILEQITENVYITKYNLKSTFFHLEGVKIPSFTGSMTFKCNGPQQFVNLLNLLISFGEYSGVGIKTAIGMGGIHMLG